jgi:3-oxoacyl-[acyl-carrier-protein] synthase III
LKFSQLAAFGHYVPQKTVPNAQIEARLGLEAGWIEQRTGIKQRAYASPGEALSDLAVGAADRLFAGLKEPREAGLLLLATSTPDQLLPPSAPLVAHRLGLAGAGAVDLAGACGGFVYALALADGFVRTQGRPALVIAANVLSRRLNHDDRASAVLFADAAGAVLLKPTDQPGRGVLGLDLTSDGSGYGLVDVPAGGSKRPFAEVSDPKDVLMRIADGQALFHKAVQMMSATARRAMAQAGVSADDITHFCPHQANGRMTSMVAHQLGIAPEKALSSIADYGNSSAATIPLTLSLANAQKPFAPGERLLVTAAGAGLTGGAAVIGF